MQLGPECLKDENVPNAALDAWIGRQDAQLSRPEAIRRLVEQAPALSQQPPQSRNQKATSLGRAF